MKTQTFFIPSYDEAQAICQANDTFYEKIIEVNGVKVSVFNYRLSQFKDFSQPIEGSHITAYEMRGLTFVHEKSGIKRYIQLHKFFNLNQVPGYQFHEVEGYDVVRTQDKCDGSMIRFIMVNGQLVAKTKMDFSNDQCQMAMEVLNRNAKLKEFVLETLASNEAAIFELVSKFNKIVISYEKTELILLQIRDEDSGEYKNIFDHESVKKYGIKCSNKEEVAKLQSYVDRQATDENIEGWVLTLSNGQMMKVKTKWYCELHGLLSENLVRENKILEMILNDTMDDAMVQVESTDIRRKYAEDIQKALIVYLDAKLHEVLALKGKYSGDRKAFAMAHKGDSLFPIAAKLLDYEGEVAEYAYSLLKNKVSRECGGLMDSKKFVGEELKVKLQNLESLFADEDN